MTVQERRTQEERTAATQRALLEATVECLVEYGYHGTTTTRVVERAGVSRGAQVHHFRTKNDLVLAAVRHLAMLRTNQFMERDLHKLRASDDWVSESLDLLWEVHQGPLFEAAMELWVAARTDPVLREQVAAFERMITGSIIDMGRSLLGEGTDGRDIRNDLYVILETIRGLSMLNFVHPAPPDKQRERWLRTKARLRLLTTGWTRARSRA